MVPQACSPGSYANRTGQDACELCPAGELSSKQQLCPPMLCVLLLTLRLRRPATELFNRKTPQIPKVGENWPKIGKSSFCQFFYNVSLFFCPIFGIWGFLYSVAGRRGRNVSLKAFIPAKEPPAEWFLKGF